MTILQTLEMALEALSDFDYDKRQEAIVSLRQQIALEKMAENEREIGIQMQPDEFKCPYCYDKPAAQSVTYQLSPTDIYDFAGWLTTRKGVMQVGASCEAGPMAEAVGDYLKTFPERFNAQPAAWVGLTNDEIWDVYKKVDSMQYLEFSRAIEAKLKSKNEHQ